MAGCPRPFTLKASALEEAVWDAVTARLRDPDRLREELLAGRASDSPTRQGLQDELRKARRRLDTIPAELSRLAAALAKGILPEAVIAAQSKALQSERGGLLVRIGELERETERLVGDERDADADKTVSVGGGPSTRAAQANATGS